MSQPFLQLWLLFVDLVVMVSRFRSVGVAVLVAALVLVGCGGDEGIPTNIALGSDVAPTSVPGDTLSADEAGEDAGSSDGVTADDGAAADDGATADNGVTADSGVTGVEPVYLSGSAAPWDSPAGMIAAMATDLPFREPPGTTISSVSVVVAADQSGSWQVSIDVRAWAEMSSDELYQLISEYPMFPRELDTLSVPTDGDFGGWHRTISMSYNPDFTPVRSLAEVSLWISGTASADEDAVLVNELAAPVRDLVDVFDPAFARRSELTWRPTDPDLIEARVWLTNTIQDRLTVARIIGERVEPIGYEVSGDRIKATMAGDGEVLVDWQPEEESDELELVFSYQIEDARPVAGTTLISQAPSDELAVVDWQARWYIDDDGEVDTGWNTPDFDQSRWRRTAAPFHRQEDDRLPGATVETPDNGMTTWFRHTVEIEDPLAFESLAVDALVDDGFVVWVNGVELHRWNMPADPVQLSTTASDRISGLDELLVRRVVGLPVTALVPGENVIAVAVHQATAESSDTRFDLRLSATTD